MRTEKITNLRPSLNIDNSLATPEEAFQNLTLRPILKFQHEVLVAVFDHYIILRKNTFSGLSKIDKSAYIAHTIKTDLKFKNRLLGLILGLFSVEEINFFYAHEAEMTRRLTALLIQRLQSHYL